MYKEFYYFYHELTELVFSMYSGRWTQLTLVYR